MSSEASPVIVTVVYPVGPNTLPCPKGDCGGTLRRGDWAILKSRDPTGRIHQKHAKYHQCDKCGGVGLLQIKVNMESINWFGLALVDLITVNARFWTS